MFAPTVEQIDLLYFVGIVLPQCRDVPEAPDWVRLKTLCSIPVLVERNADLFAPTLIARGWTDYNATIRAVRLTPAGRKVLAEALRLRG